MTLTIGIDIGGTKIAGALVDDDGTIVRRDRRKTPAQDVEAIAQTTARLIEELRGNKVVAAAGVACAGYIDRAGTTVLFSPNLAWRDEPLKQHLEDLVQVPVTIENDANAAAYGEFAHGAGKDVDDMLMLTVGTGVGGGIIFDRKLFRGTYGVGGEIGHMRVVPGGHRCGCGNRGCWEQYASGNALVREARALVATRSLYAQFLIDACGGKPEKLSGKDVTKAAQAQDPAAIELIAEVGRWLGEGAASLAALFDPPMFVVGGGVAEAGELLIGPARNAFEHELSGRGYRPVATFVPAQLGNDAGMVGAAALVRPGMR